MQAEAGSEWRSVFLAYVNPQFVVNDSIAFVEMRSHAEKMDEQPGRCRLPRPSPPKLPAAQ